MRAVVFDLDDTLVRTAALVRVHRGPAVLELTPAHFTRFDRLPGDVFDFSQFDDPALLAKGEIVPDTAKVLLDAARDGVAVAIVTARGNRGVVAGFVESALGVRVPLSLVHAVSSYPGETVPFKKALAFVKLMEHGFTEMHYYEDCRRNIHAVQTVCDEFGRSLVPYLVEPGPPVSIHRVDGRTPP